MAIRKIAPMGHPILRCKAAAVKDPTAPEIHALIQDMLETMTDASGAGLAAPQVYEDKRIVVFRVPEESDGRVEEEEQEDESDGQPMTVTVLINPEIEILTDDMKDGWEACLSVPGLRGVVPRYTHIRYSGVDREGRLIEREVRGFYARVVQHECDHLEGILYPQRMVDLSKLIFESEWRHWIAEQEQKESDA